MADATIARRRAALFLHERHGGFQNPHRQLTFPLPAAYSCRREGGAGCLIPKQKVPLPWGGASLWPVGKMVSRIAFGSCAAYDVRPQPVWEEVRRRCAVARQLLVEAVAGRSAAQQDS